MPAFRGRDSEALSDCPTQDYCTDLALRPYPQKGWRRQCSLTEDSRGRRGRKPVDKVVFEKVLEPWLPIDGAGELSAVAREEAPGEGRRNGLPRYSLMQHDPSVWYRLSGFIASDLNSVKRSICS